MMNTIKTNYIIICIYLLVLSFISACDDKSTPAPTPAPEIPVLEVPVPLEQKPPNVASCQSDSSCQHYCNSMFSRSSHISACTAHTPSIVKGMYTMLDSLKKSINVRNIQQVHPDDIKNVLKIHPDVIIDIFQEYNSAQAIVALKWIVKNESITEALSSSIPGELDPGNEVSNHIILLLFEAMSRGSIPRAIRYSISEDGNFFKTALHNRNSGTKNRKAAQWLHQALSGKCKNESGSDDAYASELCILREYYCNGDNGQSMSGIFSYILSIDPDIRDYIQADTRGEGLDIPYHAASNLGTVCAKLPSS